MTRKAVGTSRKRLCLLQSLYTAISALLLSSIALFLAHEQYKSAFAHTTATFLEKIVESKGLHARITIHSEQNDARVSAYLFPKWNANEYDTIYFDGRLTYMLGSQEFNYTMIGKRGYSTHFDRETQRIMHIECMEEDLLPPWHLIADAVRSGRVIDTAPQGYNISCDQGKLVELSFNNEFYVLCAGDIHSLVYTIYGENVKVSITLLSDEHNAKMEERTIVHDQRMDISNCPIAEFDDSSQYVMRKFLSFTQYAALEHTKQRFSDLLSVARNQRRLGSKSCDSCPNGKRVCLFVHGLGRKEGKLSDALYPYWGDIHKHVPCCSDKKFIRLDTHHSVWMDGNLTKTLCDTAFSVSKSKERMHLENLVLIGHSMGNLVIAAMIIRNQCDIGKNSKWISIQAPWEGSHSTRFALKICTPGNMIFGVLVLLGICPKYESVISLTHINDKFMINNLREWYEEAARVFRERVSAVMCGVKPTGLVSIHSAIMAIISDMSNHGMKNDGIVDYSSCRGGLDEARFRKTWRDTQFYEAKINHIDGRFYHGNAIWGNARKPVKWLQCQL